MSEDLQNKLDSHKELNDKLMALLPETDDLSLMALKGHLIIEESLNSLVKSHCSYPQYIVKARLSFAQLSNISKSLVNLPIHEHVFPAIDKLNALRNNLAHNITSEKADILANELIQICGTKDKGDERSTAFHVSICVCYILGQLSILSGVSEFLLTQNEDQVKNA